MGFFRKDNTDLHAKDAIPASGSYPPLARPVSQAPPPPDPPAATLQEPESHAQEEPPCRARVTFANGTEKTVQYDSYEIDDHNNLIFTIDEPEERNYTINGRLWDVMEELT
jgi:hypothetical protein